jgi:hypothetical protein
MRMPKAWPVLASALNDQLGWGTEAEYGKFIPAAFGSDAQADYSTVTLRWGTPTFGGPNLNLAVAPRMNALASSVGLTKA